MELAVCPKCGESVPIGTERTLIDGQLCDVKYLPAHRVTVGAVDAECIRNPVIIETVEVE